MAAVTPKVIEAKVYLNEANEAVYTPYRDRVLVEPIPWPSVSRKGITLIKLEDSAEEEITKNPLGRVLRCGVLVRELQPGDKIVMSPYGTGATLGEWGIGLILISEKDVYAKVEEQADGSHRAKHEVSNPQGSPYVEDCGGLEGEGL